MGGGATPALILGLDISVQPCGRLILVEGRRYTQFDTLLPIECKRLPMPIPGDRRRDEREYVTSGSGTTGGIQRFKLGAHGSSHSLGVMIGYIQDGRTSKTASRRCACRPASISGWTFTGWDSA